MEANGASKPLWSPSAQWCEAAEMTRFMGWAGERSGKGPFAGYAELWKWSVTDVAGFWEAIWEYCGVRASRPYTRVLDSPRMPGARWFEGAELNYAENMLARGRDSDAVAVLHASELRELGALTWGELTERVADVADGLRALGVGRGDRVVAYMPNIPEALVALLASASIGAIWSSAAPEFGARSVIDRFAQIEPVVMLCCDGYRHGGRDFDRTEALRAILAELPSVRHTVLLPYLAPSARADGLPGGMTWSELVALGRGGAPAARMPRFEQVPFDHPLWVLYSSGTTGLPKAIVHGHGGILVEQMKKSLLHLDLRAGDRMFWFTTTGWMMWNFLIGCLFSDAAIVLYDGSPAHPDMGALWRLAERTGITCMGLSAGYLGACAKSSVKPGREFDLRALRAIGSTGSPLAPESFRWVYEHVSRDVWLFSTSGGTDVCTAFVGGCPLLPVHEGELQCRALGCAVESFDEAGRSVVDEVGELVLTQPLPSMPLFFWGDPSRAREEGGPCGGPCARRGGGAGEDVCADDTSGGDSPGGDSRARANDAREGNSSPSSPPLAERSPIGERYFDSYFSMYPGVWRHGDWVRITPRGGAVIYGRSDSTINRQGIRMGTSEIYRAAGALSEVVDALVVDVPRGPGPGLGHGDRDGDGGRDREGDDGRGSGSTRDGGVDVDVGGGGVGGGGGGGGELWMILFVVLAPGVVLDDELRARVARRIREDCSPRHVPNEILQIEQVPRTLSGKVLEVPVKRILMGALPHEAASVDSLADPASLDYFVELARTLQSG